MHSTTSKELGELITERLVLRSWTAAEVAAVVSDGSRPADWAEDFPAEGDRVIAGLLDDNPAWYGPYGHRLIVERDSGLLVGSIGLFWPPTEESWRSGTASSPPGAAATTPPRPPARSPPWPSPCPASTQWPPPRNHPTRLPSASWRRRASSGRTPCRSRRGRGPLQAHRLAGPYGAVVTGPAAVHRRRPCHRPWHPAGLGPRGARPLDAGRLVVARWPAGADLSSLEEARSVALYQN